MPAVIGEAVLGMRRAVGLQPVRDMDATQGITSRDVSEVRDTCSKGKEQSPLDT